MRLVGVLPGYQEHSNDCNDDCDDKQQGNDVNHAVDSVSVRGSFRCLVSNYDRDSDCNDDDDANDLAIIHDPVRVWILFAPITPPTYF